MRKAVIFTGAGVSAESGIKTFRDSNGLWENYRIEEVATPEAWKNNRSLVLEFYNERRRQVLKAEPNPAHHAIAGMQEHFDVTVVTQNIDNLHERAGSKKVLHLHGELMKSRSTADPSLIYDIHGSELCEGEKCEKGSQLRPHIVWFGEMVPALPEAALIISKADIFIVVGSSLVVYPAAGLLDYAPSGSEKYYVDPAAISIPGFNIVQEKAGTGVPKIVEQLLRS
jgi:NAD-dependent deacetylase